MKVGVFYPPDNVTHKIALFSFASGLEKIGIDFVLKPIDQYELVDVAVVFGVGKKHVPISWPRGQIISNQILNNKVAIIIELGYVKRDQYYMVGVNGLNNRAFFNNRGMPPDRWNELETEIKPMSNCGNGILICGQVPSDASVQDVDIIEWYANLVNQLRGMTDEKIIFRPHPLAINRTPRIFGAEWSTRPLQNDLDSARVIVTYNSNTAVDAILNGKPVISFDIGCMAWDISSHDVSSIITPYYPSSNNVQQWANDLAYTQWTLDEMAEGLPFNHLVSEKFARDTG